MPISTLKYPLISIHAPREGSDAHYLALASDSDPISIHAPREGSDDILGFIFNIF